MRLSVHWPICNQQSIDSVFVYCYCEFVVAAIAFFHWFTLLHIARHRDRLLTHTKFWYERGQWQTKITFIFSFCSFSCYYDYQLLLFRTFQIMHYFVSAELLYCIIMTHIFGVVSIRLNTFK